MRTDNLISKATATSAQKIIAASSAIIATKLAGQWPSLVGIPDDARRSGPLMDWLAFALLVYLALHHLTHWMIDQPAFYALVKEYHFFGDHPESWDGPNIPLRGRLVNMRIALEGGFGYSVFTWPVLLVYVLNLLLPATLWIGAAVALVIA